MTNVSVRSLDARRLYGWAAGGWLGLAALFAGLAAMSPQAAFAHAGWCLSGGGAAAMLEGALIFGHCPWCYAAVAAGLMAVTLGLAGRNQA